MNYKSTYKQKTNYKKYIIKQKNINNQKKKQKKIQNGLSEYFVPIIYKEDLDNVATNFLKEHYPEALITPIKIDPELLASQMGLTVHMTRISKDNSIFGQIYFKDTVSTFYDRSEEHTSELQSRGHLVCRLLLEKKKK